MTDYARFHQDGYQVQRGLLPRSEIAAILREVDRLRDLVLASATLDPPLRALWSRSATGDSLLRGLHNAHSISPVIDGLRLHRAIGAVLLPLLGPDIKSVLTALFWKPPGEAATGIAYHRDAGFRLPAEAYRNLADSYVQVAIALDPQDEANGCLHLVPGSHRAPRGPARLASGVLEGDAGTMELAAFGYSAEAARAVPLEPGDLVFWQAYTLHGSPPNRTRDRDRRSFAGAFMRSADCDAGMDAYVAGCPVPVPGS